MGGGGHDARECGESAVQRRTQAGATRYHGPTDVGVGVAARWAWAWRVAVLLSCRASQSTASRAVPSVMPSLQAQPCPPIRAVPAWNGITQLPDLNNTIGLFISFLLPDERERAGKIRG